MRRKIAIPIVAGLVSLGFAAGPTPPAPISLPSPLVAVAEAQSGKSLAGGAGNIDGAGERFGKLLSGWGVPVLIAIAGILLVSALGSRNFGTAIGIVVVTFVGLIFLLAPSGIESAAKSIAATVF